MDAINTIVSNDTGNSLNQTNLVNQTVGSADFMTAFVDALNGGQTDALNGQTVDFAQLVANAEKGIPDADAQLLQMQNINGGNPQLLSPSGLIRMSGLAMTPEIQTATENSEIKATENNELSAEIARKLIMTGNARDFSAGYLSMISQSENAVDLQTILSSVGTLNGSVSQSLGLINALEKLGVTQFVGLSDNGENMGTLSAEQLVMLSTLAGNSSSPDSSGSTLVDLLLDENFGGTGNLNAMGVTALLGGFGNYSADNLMSMMSGTGGLDSVLSAFSDRDKTSSLMGNDVFSSANLLSQIFSENDKDDEMAVPMSAVIPLDALKQLANVRQKESISNLEKLAEAFENGDATLSKTTQFVMADDSVNGANQQTTGETSDLQNDLSETDVLMGENNFANAVREAKKNAKGETKINENPGAQELVRTRTLESQDRVSQMTRAVRESVTASNLRQQTVEQISAKLSQRYERVETFSVKLTPEGLGDVVVNLEKTKDGVVLQLVASRESTAKLLDGEMNEIQSALSQFNAQVSEIRVAEPSHTHNQSNDGFLNQDFSEQFQQNQGQFRQGTPRYARARNSISEQAIEISETAYKDNSKINTYI